MNKYLICTILTFCIISTGVYAINYTFAISPTDAWSSGAPASPVANAYDGQYIGGGYPGNLVTRSEFACIGCNDNIQCLSDPTTWTTLLNQFGIGTTDNNASLGVCANIDGYYVLRESYNGADDTFGHFNFTVPTGNLTVPQVSAYFGSTGGVTYVNDIYVWWNGTIIYWTVPEANISSGYSSDGIQINSSLYGNYSGVTLYNITAIFNSVETTPDLISGTTYNYTENTVLPTVSTITDVEYYYSANAIFEGIDYYIRSPISTVSVDTINITDCSSGYPVAEFYMFDEETPYTPVNTSMDITIWTWTTDQSVNSSFNFSNTSSHVHTICIEPNTSSVTAFSIQEYWNNTGDVDGAIYPSREYYLNGVTLDNNTETINLYVLNSTLASTIGLSVQDEYSNPVDDVIIKAQRFYVGENQYRTVAMGYTDDDGDAVTRLRLSTGEDDAFYRFVLERNFEVIRTIEMTKVIETSLLFTVTLETLSEYWEYWNNLGYSCSFTNATGILVCEWNDLSGLMTSVNLFVRQIQLAGYTTICDVSSTDTTGILSCDLSGMTTEKYEWWLEFVTTSDNYIAMKGIIENVNAALFGLNGVMVALILVLIVGFMGLFSPEAAIITSVAGIIACYMLELFVISAGAVVGLIIAAALLIYKVGR